MDINPLIDRRARNNKTNKRKRLDLHASLDRKQKAAHKRARRDFNDEDEDLREYVR